MSEVPNPSPEEQTSDGDAVQVPNTDAAALDNMEVAGDKVPTPTSEKPPTPTEAAETTTDGADAEVKQDAPAVEEDVPTKEGEADAAAPEADAPAPEADAPAPTYAEDNVPPPAEEAQEQTPADGSKPGTPAGSKPGSKTGTPAGSKPGTPAGSKPGTPAGSKPGTPAGPKPGTPAGSKPGTPAGSKPGTPAGSKPGTPAGSKPGTPAGSKPGTPAGSKPGTPAGSKPGTPAGSRPTSAQGGSKPASPAPGSAPTLRTGSKAGSKPPTPAGSKAGSKAPTPAGSKAGSPAPGSKPGTPKGSKPATPARSKQPTPQPEDSQGPPPPPPLSNSMQPADTLETEEEVMSTNALNMAWSFGLNKNVPVLNLTDDKRNMIMYACAHTGVLYDYRQNKQTLLQGHGNAISCSCVSQDKRWLATADKGPDSLIIVWDSYTGVPVRTIFDAHPDGGVVAMAMTPDAKYLATLSAADKQQTLAIWDWTIEGETPMCTAEMSPAYGVQTYIHFNADDQSQIVTNSESQVIFYSWEADKLEYYAPPLTDEDFNKQVGKYSQSIFLSNTGRALTATSCGNLVVWATNKPITMIKGEKSTPDKKALKLVRLQEKGINVLTRAGSFIVTGDHLGHIKFFDQTLKLVNWYQDFHLGPVSSISFAYIPDFPEEADPDSNYPPDATIAADPFALRDFVVGTTTAVYAHVTTDGTDVNVIHRDHDAAVHALAAHPNSPHLAVGGYSGLLKIWNYEKKDTVVTRWFKHGQMIRCCSYDPQGQYLAVGFMNGTVRVLDAMSLSDVMEEAFHYARDAITHVAFSHDSQYLATADAEYTVSVFKAGPDGYESQEPWTYLGRYRAHYKLIQDILWGIQLDSNQPRLMTLGKDRVLVEFDLEKSSVDNLRVLSMDRIEQSAMPLCMAWYPPVTKENFYVTANDQFKFKLYNSTTKMCRKTLLGPTYGSPLQKIAILPTADEVKDTRFLAYITEDKIGLHILPLDGNPHNSAALIAHPQGVANLATSYDGKFLFTAGGVDSTVHMWAVNIIALEAQARLGGEDLVPFYGLLDGGRDGELFRELEDYFYYGQIRSQGVDTTDPRQVSVKVPLSEIPFIMRAMGFYPSEQEVDDMLNEIKYSNYVETGQYTTEVDLGDFIKLYINHRPAFGLQAEKLQWAFEALGFKTENGPTIDRGDLLDILQTKGEHMTEYELAEYLTTLLGYNNEGGSSELQEFDPSGVGDIIEESLPQDITAQMFSDELLGFSMYNDFYERVDSSAEQTQLERKSTVAFM